MMTEEDDGGLPTADTVYGTIGGYTVKHWQYTLIYYIATGILIAAFIIFVVKAAEVKAAQLALKEAVINQGCVALQQQPPGLNASVNVTGLE